jgi:hypothetical protein
MSHYDSKHFSKCQRAIDRSDLSHNQRVILVEIVELWRIHSARDGIIYPGAEKLAKTCRLSVRTIRHALKLFRDSGFIVPVAFSKGGAKATRYTVDMDKICEGAIL